MPPLSFCYHRCYSTEPKTFRRNIRIYSGGVPPSSIAPYKSGGVLSGTCSMSDDMYYRGADSCEHCDDRW